MKGSSTPQSPPFASSPARCPLSLTGERERKKRDTSLLVSQPSWIRIALLLPRQGSPQSCGLVRGGFFLRRRAGAWDYKTFGYPSTIGEDSVIFLLFTSLKYSSDMSWRENQALR